MSEQMSRQDAEKIVGQFNDAVKVLLDSSKEGDSSVDLVASVISKQVKSRKPRKKSYSRAKEDAILSNLYTPSQAERDFISFDSPANKADAVIKDDVEAAFRILARFYDYGICHLALIHRKTGFTNPEIRRRLTEMHVKHMTNRNAWDVSRKIRKDGLYARILRAKTVVELLDIAAQHSKPR